MSLHRQSLRASSVVLSLVLGMGLACGKKPRPPASTQAPPPAPAPPPQPQSVSPETELERGESEGALAKVDEAEDFLYRSLEDINAQSPLTDIPFEFDSAALTPEARARLESHAKWVLRYPTVTVLIEGHCDERGTVQYNLALGERRADATYNYLIGLGVPEARLKTISYGKEFPLDPGHDEGAWARNRRCHFIITSK